MQKKSHRVIIDTNLWISFLLTNDFSKLDQLLRNDKLTLLFSQELLDEFVEVAFSAMTVLAEYQQNGFSVLYN